MPSTQPKGPRRRSAFAAAFLSFLFPGLGHAYAGAYTRAVAFAALPFLSLMLLGGVVLRTDRLELLGFVIQQQVLIGLLVLNVVTLVYRVVAVVDAWQVARFLNAVDAAGGGRLGRARLPLSPLSIAGLLAVILVLAGGHIAVARYNTLALSLVNCVFTDEGDATCTTPDETPPPDEAGSPTPAGATPDATDTPEALPTPIASGIAGTPAPTLPPWDGKERLNILMVGSDQRPGDSSFNTDTLIVVSIDPQTRQVAMFQVPRDMVDAPVPANAQPVWGRVYSGKINSWFTQNRNQTGLWPGKTSQARGFAALKALLGQLYGLDIRYYVMVNFQGFTKVVNTLGGLQINVQIPVAESTYPLASGIAGRIYIPAGPQHMTGAQALIYARSRHRAAGGDFDRGRRQQRVLISLREQANPRAVLANLPQLVDDLKSSIKTDIRVGDMGKLLALADGVDTKNVRSYVFAPPYYATEFLNSSRGYIIVPNLSRIHAAVKDAFSVDPNVLALRDRLNAEGAQVWVLNASGRPGLASKAADYLGYYGLDASAPNQRPGTQLAKTKIVVYNGAEADMADTIAYLEGLYHVKATMTSDPAVTVDIMVTLGRDAPTLEVDTPG
jgi:LCP family protein required for cell wall assembly